MYVLVDTKATAHVKRFEYVCKGLVTPIPRWVSGTELNISGTAAKCPELQTQLTCPSYY